MLLLSLYLSGTLIPHTSLLLVLYRKMNIFPISFNHLLLSNLLLIVQDVLYHISQEINLIYPKILLTHNSLLIIFLFLVSISIFLLISSNSVLYPPNYLILILILLYLLIPLSISNLFYLTKNSLIIIIIIKIIIIITRVIM